MHLSHLARHACRSGAVVALAAALVIPSTFAASASTTNPEPGALELSNAQLSEQAATEGMVLLENQDHALPIASSGNVAVYGVGAYKTVKGGTGSGDVNNRYMVTVRQGLENAGYTVTTSDAYWNAMTTAYDTKYPASSGGGVFGPAIDYSSVEQTLTQTTVQPKAPTDTAIFVLARNSGEGSDRKDVAGDYELSDVERADIQTIGQTYQHVIVVLNSGGIVDTSFFAQINKAANDPDGGRPLDAMLLMSQAGQESGNALVAVLNGTVNPSGKLTDTWASKYSYYPAAATFALNDGSSSPENYSEGIYVGYRYFDSFYKSLNAANPASVVNYPFGFGLSYTDFAIEPLGVTATMKDITVRARVTNVGATYSGREVVETYVSAPQTGLDKPYQELAGYAKTDVLAPGDSQILTISFDTTQLASYDESRAAWVMDAGQYLIRVGDSSRNTKVAAKIDLAQETVTEQDDNELTDQAPASVLSSDPAGFYSYDTEAQEIADAPSLDLDTSGFTAVDATSPYQQNVPIDSSSPYYAIDKDLISTVQTYLPTGQTNWENTGSPYQAKTGEVLNSVTTNPNATLFDVAKGTTSMEQFVAGLTLTQMANIVEGATAKGSTSSAVGAAGYTTAKYENLGIPGMTLSDGPAGLRITKQIATTPTTYQFGTAWPIGTMLAQTWNADLVRQVGAAIGKEMVEYGVTLWLAPGMNIHRDPLNGRNFEYYSEDPLIAGLTAAATTQGVQSNPGVGVTVKHFAANNQETQRSGGNSVGDERGLREIELKGFELAVKNAQPMAVMSSYNLVNGTYAAQNYDLLTDLLRGEWGFKGLVMSDWGGSHDAVATMYAGNDLIEPGGAPQNIINATVRQAPTIDVSGLPVYNKTVTTTRTSYAWSFNGLTPSATGAETTTTTVDAAAIANQPQSGTTTVDVINNQTFVANPKYATVNDAYNDVKAILAGSTLTAAQKAGLSLGGEVYQSPGDNTTPVVSYTVTVKGNYTAAGYNMRLGDLQRSTMRVLNIVAQSAQFKQLAGLKGVSGITVGGYTGQFDDLADTVSVTRNKVVKAQHGDGPKVSLAAAPVPVDGWTRGPVTVTVDVDDEDAVTYIDVDSGELTPYTEPITISEEGAHQVRAFAISQDDTYSKIVELDFGIDTVAPTVTSAAANSKVTLTATDDGSGVRSVEYSVAGGAWKTYTGPVAVTGQSTSVRYRATDVAGNVSAVGSITVNNPALALSTPVIKGTAQVDKTVSAVVSTHTATASLGYQWYRNGHAIGGATKSTYKLVPADAGTKVTVRVTMSAPGYTSVAKTSAAVAVAKGTLVLSTPVIRGTAKVGSTVSAVATHTAGTRVKYRWSRNGHAISGAATSIYKITKADRGTRLTVTVTVSKAGYTTVAKTSAGVAVK